MVPVRTSKGRPPMAQARFYSPLPPHAELRLSSDGRWLESGTERFEVVNGIPQLMVEAGQAQAQVETQQYYREKAAEYDRGMEVMFGMLLADEQQAREEMIALLDLKPGARVLEVGCGTGRDSLFLAQHCGELYASDLSQEMLEVGRTRVEAASSDTSNLHLLRANVMQLPFPDGYF